MTVTTRLRSLPVRLTGNSVARQPAAPEPVTVTVARVVRPEEHDAFGQWAGDCQPPVATFPESLRTPLLRPG